MATIARTQTENRAGVSLISLLFGALGVFSIGYLLLLIFSNEPFAEVRQTGTAAEVLLSFLQNFGILLPVLVILFGVYLFSLATGLARRQYSAAMWARLVLLWLVIALVGFALFTLLTTTGGSQELITDAERSQGLTTVVVALIVAAVSGGAWWWLGQNEAQYEGSESLSSRNSRTAWNLLIPSIFLLILVAARPLEQTFIASLTDAELASPEEPSFVGLANYAKLLSVRVDALPCEPAEGSTACATNAETGAVVYPNARRYLIDAVPEYRDLSFRPMNEFDLLGTHYVLSARDDQFISSIGNTLTFTVFSVILELILGLFIALVVNSKFPGRGLMRAAMLIPWAIPTVISARLWEVMLREGSSGVINQIFAPVFFGGASQSWLTQSELQIPAMIMVDVWKTTPFMALLLLAGLQVIPGEIYEAADVDGASKVRQFWNITLPLLRPAIAVALVFRTLDAVRVFDVFQVLLGERRFSMATYNYNTLVSQSQFGEASAIGVLIFIIILIFTIIYVRMLGVRTD